MKYYAFFCLFLILGTAAYPQYGYVFEDYPLPPAEVTTESTVLPIPSQKEDVSSVGMGKTGIANGRTFNSMMYNPALLSRNRFSFDIINLNLSLPPQTYDAANFLNNHIDEFIEAASLKQLWRGVKSFKKAETVQEQLDALRTMQEGIKFPKELFQNVIGTAENPVSHGIRVIPGIGLQIGNFGFSLFGVAQSAFAVEQSPILDAVLEVKIPDNLDDPDQIMEAILSLEGVLQPLMEDDTDLSSALPVAYSVSYADVVGAAGYAFNITPGLSVGANLKVIHRRFSAKRILIEDYKNLVNIFKKDLDQYITGFTMDIGGLYKFSSGTEIGLSVQNIIPVQKITSMLNMNFFYSDIFYKTDDFGNKVTDARGDTVLLAVSQDVKVNVPFDLEMPVIINLGAIHPLTENWDVALDWVDVAAQDFRFEDYLERVRIGTEYRLDAVKDRLGITFRVGMADARFTGGAGLNLYNVIQLNGAYAYDNFVGDYSYYAQIKIGW